MAAGQATQEAYQGIDCAGMRLKKAKAHLEMNLERDIKGNNDSFHKYMNSRGMTKENVVPQLNGIGVMVRKDIEKTRVLIAFSPQPLLLTPAFSNPKSWDHWDSMQEERHALSSGGPRYEPLKLDMHNKSMGPDGQHPQVLRASWWHCETALY